MTARQTPPSTDQILESLIEARERTLELVADLSDDQLMGPRLSIVNPLRWEIGHVGWFQEFWCLRRLHSEPPILSQGDSLYDSARVAHDTRWDLPLLSRPKTIAYLSRVLNRVVTVNRETIDKQIDGYGQSYFLRLALFHEQMHAEAITYTRQTLGYPPPGLASRANPAASTAVRPRDAEKGRGPPGTPASPVEGFSLVNHPERLSNLTTNCHRTRWKSRPFRSRGPRRPTASIGSLFWTTAT